MKEKSVREMSSLERRHRSLEVKVFRATLLCCIILGAFALLIGLVFYTVASAQNNITMASSVAQSAHNTVVHGLHGREVCMQVMETYRSMTPEERADAAAPEYLARYDDIKNSEYYVTIVNYLHGLLKANDVYDVYIAMYDRENEAVVYIADPDENPETMCPVGYWEHVKERELERFLDWDGEGNLYYFGRSDRHGWLCTSGIPIRADDELCGFIFTDVTLGGLIRSMRKFVRRFTLTMVVLTLLISLFATHRFRNRLVKPINAIAQAAQNYLTDKKAGTGETDHFARLNIHSGDEVENLSLIMADMERDLSEYESSLTAITAEKERIATELDLAANIQANLLPSTFPAFPEREEFDIYASMTPAKEVGGDFYDFFMVDEDHLAMVIADVSGKGIPAALFMMASRTMLKDAALYRMDPAAVLERVNAQLCENNPNYMFVTVWMGILEIPTGKLTWADAGHERLMLWQDGEWKCLPKKSGIALGALEPELLDMEDGGPFRNHELVLKPGDAVFQYTDGVTEAMTASREQFGMDRLLEALAGAGSGKPDVLLPHVRECIDAFVQGAPPFDDITMLSLQYKGKN